MRKLKATLFLGVHRLVSIVRSSGSLQKLSARVHTSACQCSAFNLLAAAGRYWPVPSAGAWGLCLLLVGTGQCLPVPASVVHLTCLLDKVFYMQRVLVQDMHCSTVASRCVSSSRIDVYICALLAVSAMPSLSHVIGTFGSRSWAGFAHLHSSRHNSSAPATTASLANCLCPPLPARHTQQLQLCREFSVYTYQSLVIPTAAGRQDGIAALEAVGRLVQGLPACSPWAALQQLVAQYHLARALVHRDTCEPCCTATPAPVPASRSPMACHASFRQSVEITTICTPAAG